jgi:hypothetical protein
MTSSNNRFTTEGTNHTEERPDLSGPRAVPGNPFYRVLALYLPWSILLCLLPPVLALIHRLLPQLSLSGPVLAPAVYLPVLLISAAVTVYLELLDPRTNHGGAHIRGAVLSILAAYLFSSTVLAVPKAVSSIPKVPLGLQEAARQFLPGLGNITAVLAVLYLWIFVIRLRDLFRAREIFEYHLRRYRGEELRRVMLEDSGVLAGLETQVRSMTRHYSIQLGIVFLLVLICDIVGAPLLLFQRILTMLVIAAAAAIFSLLNLFCQEQYFAGEGIAVPAPERRRRMGAGVLFCAGAGILSALCALGANLLPFSAIIAFFAWLARLLSRPGEAQRTIEMPQQEPSVSFNPRDIAQVLGVEETEPWPLWNYLPHIILTLIIAAFLWFMVKPLFGPRGESEKLPFILRLARLFRGALKSLRLALVNFFGSLRGGAGIHIGKSPQEKLTDLTGELLAGLSGARKRELRQSLNLFARLILWGQQNHHTTWKPSMGPGEFCAILARKVQLSGLPENFEGGPPAKLARLPPRPGPAVPAFPPLRGPHQKTSAASLPAQEPDPSGPPQRPQEPTAATLPSAEITLPAEILRCGEIFEEALYGPRLPDKETRQEFRRLVEKITG